MKYLVLLAALWGGTGCAASRPAGIVVDGAVAQPATWTSETIGERFGAAVRIVDHETRDGSVRLRAVALAELLRAAGIEYDERKKNHALALAVVVTARDGYTVVFTHDEVIPHGDEAPWVYLAFADADGPLPPRYAPARLVLTDERGRARRIRAVSHITVVDLSPSTPTAPR